jgi:pyruvate carboxylase
VEACTANGITFIGLSAEIMRALVAGQKVKPGDLLLTIEAMKMETAIHADREATVKALHVSAGTQIDAKDLLIELE